MLDINTAKRVRDAINREYSFPVFKLEDVLKMQPINGSGHTIWGLQNSNATVLVWLKFREDGTSSILKVQVCLWPVDANKDT